MVKDSHRARFIDGVGCFFFKKVHNMPVCRENKLMLAMLHINCTHSAVYAEHINTLVCLGNALQGLFKDKNMFCSSNKWYCL